MYFKVEPTGCSEKRGLVQVRYCLYLDPEDYGYEKHHVQVPVIPEGGYPGKMEKGRPVDLEDFKKWRDALPTEERDNPFHNHFCQFEPTVTDEEILFVGELALQMAKEKWNLDQRPDVKNQPVKYDLSPERKAACLLRLNQIKMATLEKAVK